MIIGVAPEARLDLPRLIKNTGLIERPALRVCVAKAGFALYLDYAGIAVADRPVRLPDRGVKVCVSTAAGGPSLP